MTDPNVAAGGDAGGDELDILEDARERRITYLGEALVIVPLRIGQIPRFTRAARPIIQELAASVLDSKGEGNAGGAPRETLSVDVALDWIDKHGEALIDAMAAATGRERQWIAEGGADEFVELVLAVLSVNLDFFVRRLLPNSLQSIVDSATLATRAMNGSGRTPFKSSSSPVTS
jgi:hypothetical protein